MTFVRPTMVEHYFNLAEAARPRADCIRRQVGAVLVRPDSSVAGVCYNGPAAGEPGCATMGSCPRGQMGYDSVPAGSSYDTGPGSCIALHAEQNVLAACREDTTGFHVYVSAEPCDGCKRTMKAHRIATYSFMKDGRLVVGSLNRGEIRDYGSRISNH